MKIEHFESQATAPDRIFDWQNLLGVCKGDLGISKGGKKRKNEERFHCDTYRGTLPADQQSLPLDPAAHSYDIAKYLSYTPEGEMRAKPGLAEQDRSNAALVIQRLNLNISMLRRNRREVIGRLRERLRKDASVANVKRMLRKASTPDSDGLLEPYCQVAIDYLSKKLRQLESQKVVPCR